MSSERNNLPENSKIIDNSVFSSIINRLETVEKKETGTVNNEVVTKLSEDVLKLTEQLSRIGDEGIKHNLAISKHTEQLFRFERELVETKDILKTFMIKYDLFAADTNNKFSDYEFALSELEKNIQPLAEPISEVNEKELEGTTLNDIDTNENASSIMSVDLKNIIKQELANV
jgi:predicted  nucleic acid-binding Zn-ribbon protein